MIQRYSIAQSHSAALREQNKPDFSHIGPTYLDVIIV